VLMAQTGPAGVGTSATNALWLKANAGTSSTVNNTPISAWNDQSGNGINVAQPTANQQPSFATNVINGFPAIQFDNVNNTNDKLLGPDSPLLDNTTGYTFYMVTRPLTVDNNARAILSKRTGVAINQSFMHFFFSGSTFYTDIQTNNDRYNTSSTFAANNNYIITQMYNGTLAAAIRCSTYISGNLDIVSAETSTSVPDNNSPLVIASTDAGDPRPLHAYLPEIIVYRSALNEAGRIIVENYLSAKYSIALSANDRYAGDNVGNGNYDFEVAGIGQEASGSSTSFSPSISGGLGISVNSGLDNGDYIMAGHALATNSAITSDVGGMTGSINSRWERIWYFDITNTSTAINTNITFDVSDAGIPTLTLGVVSNYVLLYRAAQTGNWTELTTASSISGDQIIFNNINLTNDGYYTIGTRNFNASPLPVELFNFTAEKKGNYVEVKWSTASEKDADYFLIEKSEDAILFEKVNQIKAKGNSSQKNSYRCEDSAPYSQTNYYRIRTFDTDGSFETSQMIALSYKLETDFVLFPNPAEDSFTLQFDLTYSQAIKVQVINELGKISLENAGVYPRGKQSIQFNTEGLSSGAYLVILYIGEKSFTKKMTIK